MVRMTVACTRCRKLKVKCLHGGTAPCRSCAKKGPPQSESCVLSRPELKSRAASTPRRRPQRQPSPAGSISSAVVVLTEELATAPAPAPAPTLLLLDTIELAAVLQACAAFVHKFPELRFLHQPTFAQRVRLCWTARAPTDDSRKLRLLCAAIMAVCGPGAATAEQLAGLVRKHMSGIVGLQPPDIATVQTLVVLSMYDWGVGSGYRAWMYAGMATRMMQSLLVLARPSTLSATGREEHSRTFWSCFVMDRLVFCGRPQPFALPLNGPHVRWPAGEQDYVFGTSTAPAEPDEPADELFGLGSLVGDMDHYYAVLVRGFDVWARIVHFVAGGGRRQRGLCLPENHPWVAGSPWKLLYDELLAWRGCMDGRLCYPQTAVEGHAALRQAEPFAYVNLLFHVSILLLGREYVPFLPTSESQPAGPVDQLLLPLRAPSGWWADRSAELFRASASIVELLRDLDDAETPLQSPFAGFCSFSAATMNLYVSSFPRMNLGRSGDMAAIVTTKLRRCVSPCSYQYCRAHFIAASLASLPLPTKKALLRPWSKRPSEKCSTACASCSDESVP